MALSQIVYGNKGHKISRAQEIFSSHSYYDVHLGIFTALGDPTELIPFEIKVESTNKI